MQILLLYYYHRYMEEFTDDQITHTIESLQFRSSPAFNASSQCMLGLVEHIKGMALSHTSDLWLASKLIQFYGFPVLVHFAPAYSRVPAEIWDMYAQQFRDIAGWVGHIIEGKSFEELEFFFRNGDENKPSLKKKTCRNFQSSKALVQDCHKISSLLSKIRRLHQISQQTSVSDGPAHECRLYLRKECQKLRIEMKAALGCVGLNYEGPPALLASYIVKMNSDFCRLYQNILDQPVKSPTGSSAKEGPKSVETDEGSELEQGLLYHQPAYPNQNEQSFYLLQQQLCQEISSPTLAHQVSVKKDHKLMPCCWSHFTQGQLIANTLAESISYVDAGQLYSSHTAEMLKKEMCSLLNREGGAVFVGFQSKGSTNCSIAVGIMLTESEKQEVATYLRTLAQCIQPDIVACKLYELSFLAVAEPHSSFHEKRQSATDSHCSTRLIPGLNVLRIRLRRTRGQEVYSYTHEEDSYFSFRNIQGTYVATGRALLTEAKKVFQHAFHHSLLHEGPCQKSLDSPPIYQKPQIKIIPQSENQHRHQRIIRNKNRLDNQQAFSVSRNKTTNGANKSKKQEKQGFDPKKLTPFGLAYDFLLYGVESQLLLSIFSQLNYSDKLAVEIFAHDLVYIRNRHKTNLHQFRNTLKNLHKCEQLKQAKLEIIPITHQITLTTGQEAVAQQLWHNLADPFAISPDMRVLSFRSTCSACQAYILLRSSKIACRFTVPELTYS